MLSSLLKIKKFFSLTTIVAATLGAQLAGAIDFESIYQLALKNSTELAISKAKSDEATALFKASNSSFLPRLGVESRYELFDSEFEKVRGGTANAFAEWNLFNGFKDIQNRKGLSADAKAATLDRERAEFNFRWIAMSRYTKAQAMQEAVEVYRKTIDANLKNLEAVKLRRSSGRISDADFIEFELFGSKLNQDLIKLETEAIAAVAELQAFSGVNSISKLTTILAPKPLKLDQLNFQELLSSTKSKLQESQLKVEAAEARKSLTTGGFLPEVNLKATYGSLGLRETIVAPESAFGITARWEFFSGLESVNNSRVASAQLARVRADFDNSKIQNLSRAAQLKNQLNSLLVRFDFEQENQKQIDRYLKTVQEEYRRGVKGSNELKSALELVLETQLSRIALRSDYFEARAELQGILGIEIDEK